ncbi:LVIVD repeat-containing protein [Streptomyces sp. NPDC048179]|uniref:LVIVD repeat-containing protein n=1 Tax=Streptomyces sp. NPDC048179 TaxID=3365506 RepID=UPI0037140FE7
MNGASSADQSGGKGDSPGPANAALAQCGPGSLPETGLQGQVPLTDPSYYASGYRCNLQLVGQYTEDGTNVALAWYKDCAYTDTGYSPTDPKYNTLKGVRVIDAADPAHPRRTALLQTPAMSLPQESLHVNQARGLLGAVGNGYFDLYSIRQDCARPRLLASVPMFKADALPHSGGFSPDGTIYYAVGGPLDSSLMAIDITEPGKPRKQYAWKTGNQLTDGQAVDAHQVYFGPDDPGDLVFLPQKGANASPIIGGQWSGGGLVIADVSGLRARRPDPSVSIVGQVDWADGKNAMSAPVGRIGDRTYAFVSDEVGLGANAESACAAGQPPFGFVHVVDVTDVRHPRQVSTIRLQIDNPANCAQTRTEPGPYGIAHSSHICAVDNPENVTALTCDWLQSGVRVFDVRDPLHPREIAYYNPAPIPGNYRGIPSFQKALVSPCPCRDYTPNGGRWVHARDGSWQLWIVSGQNGFQILRFTNGSYPLRDVG